MKATSFVNGEFLLSGELAEPDFRQDLSDSESIEIYSSELEHLIRAIQSANKAKLSWSARTMKQRVEVVQKAVEELRSIQSDLIQSEVEDALWFLDEAKLNYEQFFSALDELLKGNHCEGVPLGIVGISCDFESRTTWTLYRVIAALITGNAVFVLADYKNVSPLVKALVDLTKTETLPQELVHLFISEKPDFREMFFSHPSIKGLMVKTSSTEGLKIRELLSRDFRRVNLELDGRGVALIFDKPSDEQYSNLLDGFFSFNSYYRWRPSRIFIVDKIMDEAQEELKERIMADPRSQLDVSSDVQHLLESQWELSIREEGRGLLNENNMSSRLVTELPNCALIQQQSIYGPMATFSRVKYPAEAVKFANTTPLASMVSIWCEKAERFEKFSSQMEAPIVLHNSSIPGFQTKCWNFKASYWGFNGRVVDFFRYQNN